MILTNQSNQARRKHQERCTWGHCFAYIYFKQENKPFLVKSARALKRYENFSINFVLTISSASWAWKTSSFQFSWLNCGSNVCNYQWFNIFSGEITIIIIHLTHYLFSDWPKAYSEFSKSALRTSSSRRLYWRSLISQGHHFKFTRFVLPADLYIFTRLEINYQFHLLSWPIFFRLVYNKTVIIFGFLWYPE